MNDEARSRIDTKWPRDPFSQYQRQTDKGGPQNFVKMNISNLGSNYGALIHWGDSLRNISNQSQQNQLFAYNNIQQPDGAIVISDDPIQIRD